MTSSRVAPAPLRSPRRHRSRRLTFHLLAHTHWDREWYLPRAAFVARLVPALDELVERLERDPGFRSFQLDGQSVLLEDYLRVRPGQRTRIEALARAGRLQIGPWYVLADELIPSGESLVRNLLFGAEDGETLSGTSRVLYSPDAFGHPAAWPALAAEFALPYGVVWRGLGGERGQMGDLYRWAAPDGREVLVHHLPPGGYEAGSVLVGDDRALAAAWARLRPVLVGRSLTSQVAVPVGADHHAPLPGLERLRDRLAGLEPEADVRLSRWDEFLDAAAAEAAGVPTIRGELRWSYGYTWTLQGVHGTRAPLKRRHVDAELWLERVAEPLTAVALLARRAPPSRPLLRDAWRTLVRCQFHDTIGGCTSDAVATRVLARIEDAECVGREVAAAALDSLVGNHPDLARAAPERAGPRLVLWNPVPRRRDGAVVVADLTWFRRDVLVGPPGSRRPRTGPGARPFSLSHGAGAVAVQLLGRFRGQERLDAPHHYPDQDEVDVTRVAFRAPPLRGLGLAALEPAAEATAPMGNVATGQRQIDNGLVTLSVARDGSVTLLERATGVRLPELLRLESTADLGDTYTRAPLARDRPRRLREVEVRVLAGGPLVGALELRGTLPLPTGLVAVRSVLSLHAGSPVVRCTLDIDNRATDHRLRLRCPTGAPGGEAMAGTAFVAVRRPAVLVDPARYPREWPVRTAPAQRFVARADRRRGLALLLPGFFEYELTPAGDLLLTLLRSVGELSRGDLPSRPGHAAWPLATPGAQCLGTSRARLALAAVTAAMLDDGAALPRLWEDCFLPPQARWLRQATPLQPAPVELRLEGEGLVFTAAKPAERGRAIVLRCYNGRGESTAGAWRVGHPVTRAIRLRADEREESGDELALEDDGRRIPLMVSPYGIATVRIETG